MADEAGSGPVAVRATRRRITGVAVVLWAVLAVVGAACSTLGGAEGGGAEPDGDVNATSEDQPLASESIDADGADADAAADEVPPAGPTLDGSATPGDVTDVWTMVDDDDFVPDAPGSRFDDMEADSDGNLVIAGSTIDHEARSYHATIWSSGDAGASLSREILPTLLDGVSSDPADVEFVPATSPLAVEAGITQVLVGSVGSGPGLRAAVWLQRNGEWMQLESDAFLSERQEWTHRLSVGPDGELLVLGSTTSTEGETSPVAWYSTDGTTWTRLSEAFDDLPDTTLSDAALSADTMVVVGQYIEGTHTWSQLHVSTDGGVTWDHAVPPGFGGDGDGDVVVASVVSNPAGGFVAVGRVGDGAGVDRPASWTSEDGVTWDGPSTSFGTNDDGRTISSGFGAERVRTSADGFLAIATSSFLQHVWSSPDGSTWNPVGNIWDAESDGVDLSGIASIDDMTVAVGEGRVFQFDGRWRPLRVDDDVVPRPSEIPWSNAIAAGDGGFAIVGGVEEPDGDLRGWAWTSDDGEEWSVVGNVLPNGTRQTIGPYRDVSAHDDGFLAAAPETTAIATARRRAGLSYLHLIGPEGLGSASPFAVDATRVILSSVGSIGDDAVVAGITFDGTTVEPVMVEGPLPTIGEPVELEAVSISTPSESEREGWSGICSSPETIVAALGLDDGSNSSVAFFARSSDSSWVRAEAGVDVVAAKDRNWVNACTHGADGFLAVGAVRSGLDTDGAVWYSPDGSSWEILDVPASLTEPAADGWVTDATTHGPDYLLVGAVEIGGASTGTLWIGSPDAGWTEVPAANDPVGFDPSGIAVDQAGTVVITGWQDGQMTVVKASIEDLR